MQAETCATTVLVTEADQLARTDSVCAPDEIAQQLGEGSPLAPQKTPEVSVLIPAYQAGPYVAEAIASVFAQVDMPIYELIVVDDGSKDDTATHACAALEQVQDAAARPLRVVLARMPHRGQAASRNTGLACATGRWVCYLDADDTFRPTAVRDLLAGAAEAPAGALVCARCQDFISPELTADEAARLKINPEPYQRMLAGCMLISRATYAQVGAYDEKLPSSETAQWMLRAKDAGLTVHNIDAITLDRRYHRNNFGRRDRKTQLQSYMAIIKQRRAQLGGQA